MNKLERKLEEYIKEKEEKIRNAESNEERKFNFYGASHVIFFLYLSDIISSELYNKYDEVIEKANDIYYEKAKKDFENAHKRIFD